MTDSKPGARMKGTPKSLWRRNAVLLAGFAFALLTLTFRTAITHRVTGYALMANDAPSVEALQSFLQKAPDPDRAILAAWNTGKVLHRQIAVRELAGRSPGGPPLKPEVEAVLIQGALDPDLSVREAALGGLRYRRHPSTVALAAAQLRDLDPQIRLLGLNHLKPFPAAKALPSVAPLIHDPDLRVAGTALKLVEHWSKQDFGAKLADTIPVEDPATGHKALRPDAAVRVQSAIAQGAAWWEEHQSEFPDQPPSVPTDLLEVRRPVVAGDFSLKTLDGRTLRLSDFRGKVVLINFWTTWCTACLVEIPSLVQLQERYRDDLVVLGISLDYVPDSHGHIGGHNAPDVESTGSTDETYDGQHGDSHEAHGHEHTPALAEIRAKVERTAKKLRISYPVLLDERNVVGGRFNGGELPTTVLVDGEGMIRRRFVGARDLEVFEAMIQEASAAGNRRVAAN